MQKEIEVAKILTMLCEAYGKEISKEYFKLYCSILMEYDLEEIKKAAINILRTNKYASLPKPADFISFMRPDDEIEYRAAEALRELEHQQIMVGSYSSVIFEDTVLQSVVQYYGGWVAICDHVRGMNDREYDFFRKEFTRLYKLYARRPNDQSLLEGRHAIENRAAGYIEHVPQPVLIGHTIRKTIEDQKKNKKMIKELSHD